MLGVAKWKPDEGCMVSYDFIEQTSQLVREISSSSEEQSAGVSQMNITVT